MKTKSKIILTICIFIISITNISAQQKYEFMTINYSQFGGDKEIIISVDGKELQKEEIKLEKNENNVNNINPLLTKVKQYQDKGWEVMSFNVYITGMNNNGYNHLAYLRKKQE